MKIKELFNTYFGMFGNKEDDPLDGLMTVEEKKKKTDRQFKVRFFGTLIVLPIILTALFIVVKSYFLYFQQFDETQNKKTNKPLPKMSMEVNGFTTWQNKTDTDISKLQKEIELTSKNVSAIKDGLEGSKKTQEKQFTEFKDEMLNAVENMQNSVNSKMSQIQSATNNAIEQINSDVNAKITKQNSNIKTKLSDLSVAKSKPIKLNIAELPDVNSFKKKDKTPKTNKNNLMNITPLDSKEKFAKNLVPEEIYEEVEEEYDLESFEISTLEDIKKAEAETNKEEELPSFYLMPGFAKAVIVAGADAPTMSTGTTDPKRVWLSIITEQFIANNGTANFKDCLLSGIAKGRIVNGRGRINIDTISCEMMDPDGQKYQIKQQINGLVYGEDGKSGAKGRLVSKEGEIIKRGIPLAAIEGAIATLSKTKNYILPTNGSSTENASPLADFATGGANTGSKILQKFSEYYLKILEELTPYVEIRAKRVVTVAFEGGETLTPKKYNPMDINHFYNKETSDEFIY